MSDDRPTILFVCVHNAGRSQMAAGLARKLGGDRVVVRSAGSDPGDAVNPAAVEAMSEIGIDIHDAAPRLLETDSVRAADVIVTMGCGDACPHVPAKHRYDWQIPDPRDMDPDAFRGVRDLIESQVRALLASLGARDAQ